MKEWEKNSQNPTYSMTDSKQTSKGNYDNYHNLGKGPLHLLLDNDEASYIQLTKEEQGILISLFTNSVMTSSFKDALKHYIITSVYKERGLQKARELQFQQELTR